MKSFEQLPQEEVGPKKEWVRRPVIEWFKKYARYGALIGAMYGGLETMKAVDQHKREKTLSSMSETERQEYETLYSSLSQRVGEINLLFMEQGFRDGQIENKEVNSSNVEYRGFDTSPEEIEGIQKTEKYVFTEKYGMYPKNWINGEVKTVQKKAYEPGDQFAGLYSESEFEAGPGDITLVVMESLPFNSDTSAHFSSILAHESGHANDWINDKDLSLYERIQLLNRTLERMESDDHFKDWPFHSTYEVEYHESYLDGTAEGTHRACKEYWADICEKYFHDPSGLQKRYPKDFALVDEFVKKNDPGFDIFDPNRGAFDPEGGGLKPIYQAKL